MIFGKKEPEAPHPPYSLLVLGTEHIIEGTVEGETQLGFGSGTDPLKIVLVAIDSATITALRPASPEQRSADHYAIVCNNTVILVPHKDLSPRVPEWRALLPGERTARFHVGPYVVEGTLLCGASGKFLDQVPALDVKISASDIGSEWPGVEAPYALINYRFIEGWEDLS